MNKYLKAIILTIIAGAVFAGCTAGGGNDSSADDFKEVKLGYPIGGIDFIDGVGGLALELGYLEEELEKEGFKLNSQGFTGAGPAVNEALASGNIDFALYADFPGIVIQSRGIDTRLISIVNTQGHAGIVVGDDSGIESVADLKGKKIAYPRGTFIQKYLLQALEEYGLSEADVELINMTTDAEAALVSGDVDAIAYTDGVIANLAFEKNIGKIINTSRENDDWTGAFVLIGRSDFIDGNEKAATAFLRAFIRAKEYAVENPQGAYEIFAEKSRISIETAEYLYGSDDGAFEFFSLEIEPLGLDKVSSNKDFLIEEGLIQDDFDVYNWGDNRFFEEANR